MEDVSYLQKDGTVKFNTTNYKYLSEEKITTAVRQSMIKHGLVMYPKLIQQLESSNEYLDEIIITYRLVNVEDPTDFIDINQRETVKIVVIKKLTRHSQELLNIYKDRLS